MANALFTAVSRIRAAPDGHSCISQYYQFIDVEDVPASAYGHNHVSLGTRKALRGVLKYLPSVRGPQFFLYNCLDTIPADLHQTIISSTPTSLTTTD